MHLHNLSNDCLGKEGWIKNTKEKFTRHGEHFRPLPLENTSYSTYHLISPSHLLSLSFSLSLFTLVSFLILLLGTFTGHRIYGLLLLINVKEYDLKCRIHSRRWWTLNKQISCFHANNLSNTNKTKQRRKCSQSVIQAVVQLNRRDFRIFQRPRRVSSYPSDFSNSFLQMVSSHNVGWRVGKGELEEWQSNLRTLQNSQCLSCSISSPQWETLTLELGRL